MLHQDFLSTFRVSFFPLRVGLNLAFLPRGTSLLKTCQLSPSVSCKQGFRTTYRMPQLVQFITPRSPGTKPFSSKCGVLLPPRKLVTRVLSSGMEQYLWRATAPDNSALVQLLLKTQAIHSSKVANVMERVDRRNFVPEKVKEMSYVDIPIPIGYSATISAPHMHAKCLELLEDHLLPGARALDVGSGTGYLTAAFGLMVGDEGKVVGVEHIPELVELSAKNVGRTPEASDLLSCGSLSLNVGDGRQGWPDLAPYDAIHVGAAAREIPQALLDQLKPGGRMVIPVGDIDQDLRVVDKKADGSLHQWTATSVCYVPLTGRDEQLSQG